MLRRYLGRLWGELSERGRRTLPYDLLRGGAAGALGVLPMLFALLVAIRYFDASLLQKAAIAGAHPVGLLLSPLYAAWSPALGGKPLRAAIPVFLAAAGLVTAATATTAAIYAAGMVAFHLCLALNIPVMTAIYRENYRGSVRGQVVGLTMFVTVLVGLAVQLAGGRLLDHSLANYRMLYLALAGVAGVMGAAIVRMPASNAREQLIPNPLSCFGALRENRAFSIMLFAWFLFGFANLALAPQRIEYVTHPDHGLELSPAMTVLIVGVITEATRICTIPIWARLFDRLPFTWMRIYLNVFTMLYVLVFYHTKSLPLLMLASMFAGAGNGGGSIAWALWVTKFAPPEQTARYMAVHAFLTGVRGSIAPLVGYLCVRHFTIETTAWLAFGLIAVSIGLMWSIRNRETRADRIPVQAQPIAGPREESR